MGAFSFKAQIDISDITRKLEGLKLGVQNSILRKALGKAAKIVLKSAKSKCPIDTGALRASLISVVRTGKRRGSVYALVGPERSNKKNAKTGQVLRSRLGKYLDKRGLQNLEPANYAHQVEFGHKIVRGGAAGRNGKAGTGRVVGTVPPHPFLRPAWDESVSAVRSTIAQIVGEEIAKVASGRASLWSGIADGDE